MFFKRKQVVDDVQASLTSTTFGLSGSGRKENPYLLQEDEQQEAEEANDDTDVNIESNKIDEENNGINISMEEE